MNTPINRAECANMRRTSIHTVHNYELHRMHVRPKKGETNKKKN